MLKGTTKTGFKFEIHDDKLNDYELFEVISEVDTNPFLLPKLVTMLLGEDQKKKLMNHLRTEDGRVPLDKIGEEIMEIFTSGRKLKNS